ncbi:inclusion body family protein [Archangium lipolyticum]|uniref:inclusion body family protein n=1 Tax=Archangium lipolyticum TaxID=2970465 RepID=UPI002149EBB7|nr:inclusion body family protein [Archangium lipolyticum]
MTGNLKKLAVCAVVAFGGVAMAQDQAAEAPAREPVKAPSGDAVKTTWDYFYKGQGQGPVLVEAKLCTEVAKDGPNKFECITEVAPEGVKANTSVMVWQSYLVPQGDSIEDLMVQVKQGNVVRETKDVKVKGDGWRARQWTGVRLSKPGDWSVVIMRGEQVLKTFNVKVL